MRMKTSEEARLCINIHLRCSVSFQPSRISTYLLQQINQLLFYKQYQRVKLGSYSPATGRSPASIVSFLLYMSICQSMLPCGGTSSQVPLLQDREERRVG